MSSSIFVIKKVTMNPKELTTIVYHGHCIDGLTAAALALHYANTHELHYEFVPMKAGETPNEVMQMANKKLLFIDVAPKLSEYQQLLTQGNEVNIRDHHATAKEELETVIDGDKVIFDMNMSGATLALDLFGAPAEFLKVIYHVEDKDLHTKKYGDSSDLVFFAMCDAVDHFLFSNVKIERVLKLLHDYDGLVQTGLELQEKNNAYIKESINRGIVSRFGPHMVFFTFTDAVKLCGEIGNQVLFERQDVTFTMVIYPGKNKDGEDVFNVSLRSRPSYMVSDVAKLFGGGGHPQAAGFSVKKLSTLFQTLKTLN